MLYLINAPGSNWCFSFAPELVGYSAPRDLHRRAAYSICESWFLSHLLIAGCDIGVQISVRPSVRPFVRSSVRPSTFTSKFGFLDIRDSCESETLHSNCP